MNNHPITPSSELVHRWAVRDCFLRGEHLHFQIATQAARWGADQELEACCQWADFHCSKDLALDLRDARRPKPRSLKQQALDLIDGCKDPHGDCLDDAALDIIRRALEQLDE